MNQTPEALSEKRDYIGYLIIWNPVVVEMVGGN